MAETLQQEGKMQGAWFCIESRKTQRGNGGKPTEMNCVIKERVDEEDNEEQKETA